MFTLTNGKTRKNKLINAWHEETERKKLGGFNVTLKKQNGNSRLLLIG
jgi:hypothetical protein